MTPNVTYPTQEFLYVPYELKFCEFCGRDILRRTGSEIKFCQRCEERVSKAKLIPYLEPEEFTLPIRVPRGELKGKWGSTISRLRDLEPGQSLTVEIDSDISAEPKIFVSRLRNAIYKHSDTKYFSWRVKAELTSFEVTRRR